MRRCHARLIRCLLGLAARPARALGTALRRRPPEPFFPRERQPRLRRHALRRPPLLPAEQRHARREREDRSRPRARRLRALLPRPRRPAGHRGQRRRRARPRFSRGTDKLKIAPATPVAARRRASTVVVDYRGRPRTITDPDGSEEGWYRTADGALAVGEPVGTAAWLPCNNVPADKASFEIALTVPRRRSRRSPTAACVAPAAKAPARPTNGASASRCPPTWRWSTSAAASWSAARSPGCPPGPSSTRARPSASRRALAKLPEIDPLRVSASSAPTRSTPPARSSTSPQLGYALETQTRPIYAFVPDLPTLVHETAHQWFGDSVGLERWPDIWLNEGFATWTEWYYAERHGGRSARQIFRRLYRVPASNTGFWDPPSGQPRPAQVPLRDLDLHPRRRWRWRRCRRARPRRRLRSKVTSWTL